MHGINNLRLHWPVSLVQTTRPRRPAGWRRTGAAVAGGIVGLLTIVAVAGAGYESIASAGDAARYVAPGRMVDVGGYRLHLDCRGEGTPAVVMDAGLGGSSLDWTLVQDALATTTKVCTYDRAGMGWSETGPGLRSPARIAAELWTLLGNAGVPGPYVLVAHSLAGKNARMFSLAHPEAVAGMVLVDARSEYVDAHASKAEADGLSAGFQAQGGLYTVARRLGIARLLGASLADQPLVPTATAAEMVLLQTSPSAVDETIREGLARSTDDVTLAAATLGSRPLAVIAASESLQDTPHWVEAQRLLSTLSTKGRFIVAEHSNHYVQLQQPNIVLDAVRDVLADLRN